MGSLDRGPHALVIALPHQGHWNPTKIFIRQLVAMHIPVTVLASPDQVSELQILKHEGLSDKWQHLELVEVFSNLPKGERMLKTVHSVSLMEKEFWGQPAIKENLVAQKSAGSGPTFLVSDMFLYWTQDIADQLDIPRYTFYTSPTTFALLILHVQDLFAYDPSVTKKRDVKVNLTGMEIFHASDICWAMFVLPEYYKSYSKYLPKAAGILINSWESYEEAEVAALRTGLEKVVGDGKVPSIHLIGPLQCLPVHRAAQNRKELTAETDDTGCLRFLDTQPARSVLYICFGSVAELDQKSINNLARGLELSEEPFLWILPRPNQARNLASFDVSEILPQGFQSRTKGRGFVCSDWAPQQDILAHSSVGGFLSHCGWNSLVETILAGVAVIPWPYWAEQFMNARFAVDVAKVGVLIKSNADGTYEAEEIAKAVKTLMKSDEGKETTRRIQELGRTVEIAVAEGGSSLRALQAFHEEVSSLRK